MVEVLSPKEVAKLVSEMNALEFAQFASELASFVRPIGRDIGGPWSAWKKLAKSAYEMMTSDAVHMFAFFVLRDDL